MLKTNMHVSLSYHAPRIQNIGLGQIHIKTLENLHHFDVVPMNNSRIYYRKCLFPSACHVSLRCALVFGFFQLLSLWGVTINTLG